MSSTLIKGAHLIDPSVGLDEPKDILIENGVVAAVDTPGSIPDQRAQEVISAQGQWLVPGLIDLHVHFREPGLEWKETIATGSQAAVLGGYTTVCCMPNTRPVNDHAEIAKFIQKRAQEAGFARVLPIGSVSKGLDGENMSPLSELRRAGCIAFSDDGKPIHDSGLMRRALEWCLMLDVPIACHEEDTCLSCHGSMNESPLALKLGLRGFPTVAEDVMVARDIELAHFTGGRVHVCHISSARGVELVRRAKNDGIRISTEVTAHHLMLTEDSVKHYDSNYKMSPPLRGPEIVEALWEGLRDGTIDAIASDHAPHEADSKNVEFELASMGILGLQTSLPLILEGVREGKLSRKRAIEVLSTGPAQCFKLEGGSLARGKAADLVLIDPNLKWTFDQQANRSKSSNSPFLGKQLIGRAQSVIVGGRLVVTGGVLVE